MTCRQPYQHHTSVTLCLNVCICRIAKNMERSHTRQQRRGTGLFLSLFHFWWRCSAGDPDSSAAAVAVVLIVFNCFNSVLCLGASCFSWLSDLGWNIMALLAQGLLLTLIILKLLLKCQTFPHVASGSELPLTYTRCTAFPSPCCVHATYGPA